jgi:hypothetical protein
VFTLSHSQGLKASEVDEGVHGDGGDLIVAKVSVSNEQHEKQRCKQTCIDDHSQIGKTGEARKTATRDG